MASGMIFANRALLPSGWARQVRIGIEAGRIGSVTPDAVAGPGDLRADTLLPAQSNLHSHTFQRAMAGMAETRAAGQDSFWTWRQVMYRFLDRLAPEDVEAIAAMAFAEMQEAGFAAVAEFHYLHHQPGGAPYADPAELGARIFAAAAETGIGLTHLPVLYCHGGAGRQPLAGGQLRFGGTVERFATLLDRTRGQAAGLPADFVMGVAPHSLRAVAPEDMAHVPTLARGGPIHIHAAEQPKEVADILAWLGKRPVDWLLAETPVGDGWCVIHASHMTAEETRGLARSGAVAGLCPVTEANLGDGPFDGPGWIASAGAFGVGTDSNVRISLTDELRGLEYSQRLRDLSRNVMIAGEGSVGDWLYRAAASGGAKALGRAAGAIAPGLWADLVAIDSTDPSLCALSDQQMLDGFVFAAPPGVVSDLWSAGRHMVRQGRHIARDRIAARYRARMATLAATI